MRKKILFLNVLILFLIGFSQNTFSEDPIEPTWYRDDDGDGWGTFDTQAGFTCPQGFTDQPGDCDDTNSDINPGSEDTWYDGVDHNCDGKNDYDKDGDGYVALGYEAFASGTALGTGDCDDNNPLKNPLIIVGDGIDQNCDDLEEWYGDFDGDGYRSEFPIISSSHFGPGPDAGQFDESTPVDCDDHNSAINGSAMEIVGDAIDQNCDGKEKWYADVDNDGYRSTVIIESTNIAAPGMGEALATATIDCDDNNASAHPGATEIWYDGVDQNCDGKNDYDKDGDGYVAAAYNAKAGGTATGIGDCNDTKFAIHPGTVEIAADGVDQNCDGKENWYADYDNDGFRTNDERESTSIEGAEAGMADASALLDCDDGDPDVNPDAYETCDGKDNDCDGLTDEGVTTKYFRDADGDTYGNITVTSWACSAPVGYVSDSTDCTDSDIAIHSAVGPVTITGLDFAPVGKPITYTATAANATGYMWSNSAPSAENTKTVTFTQHGKNVLSVNADNDCSDRNGSITVSVVDTSMFKSTIENLKTDTTNKRNTIAALNTLVIALKADTTTKRNTIVTLNGQVSGLINQVIELKADTTTKRSTITTINGQVSSLNTQVTGLKADTTAKHNSIETLNGQVSGLNTQVTALIIDTTEKRNTITNLKNQLATSNALVTGLKTDTSTKADIIIDLRSKLSQGKYTRYDTIRITIMDTVRTNGLAEYKFSGDTLKFSTKNLVQLTAQVEVKAYPNPTRDMVMLTSSIQFDEILIYSMSGVLKETLKPTAVSVQLNVSNYSAGTYYISLRKGTMLLTKVVIVKK